MGGVDGHTIKSVSKTNAISCQAVVVPIQLIWIYWVNLPHKRHGWFLRILRWKEQVPPFYTNLSYIGNNTVEAGCCVTTLQPLFGPPTVLVTSFLRHSLSCRTQFDHFSSGSNTEFSHRWFDHFALAYWTCRHAWITCAFVLDIKRLFLTYTKYYDYTGTWAWARRRGRGREEEEEGGIYKW